MLNYPKTLILYFISYIILFYSIIFSSCNPEPNVKIPKTFETGKLVDIDGNIYSTVKIGNQWWMQENLRVTKFRNGVKIFQAQDQSEWIKPFASFCLYQNITSSPGLLYNFYTIQDTNQVAPTGWHIPSEDEWKELEKFLGMPSDVIDKVNFRGAKEGDALKMDTEFAWNSYGNVNPSNLIGFNGEAGSCRLFNGVFGNPGLRFTGFWWTSTLFKENAWYRYLDYKKSNIFRYYAPKNYGFSIRCIKD